MVSENEDGSKPVANGGSVLSGSGYAVVYVRFTIKNAGNANAADFKAKRGISNNGTKIYDPTFDTLNLAAGASKEYPPEKITVSQNTNKITANMLVDIASLIKESNERNNSCKFRLTVQTVH